MNWIQVIAQMVANWTGQAWIGWAWTLPTFSKENKMGNFKYFTDQELAGLKDNLPAMLDMARGLLGQPIILTFTTGGLHCQNSAHYLGLAVDIGLGHLEAGFERDTYRWALLKALFDAGFKRIECAPAHLHVDIGQPPSFVSPTFWMGTDQ